MMPGEHYLHPDEKQTEAGRLGLECVECFWSGIAAGVPTADEWLDRESALGGCKIEGIVIKNYTHSMPDGKLMCAKLVSEAFKEKHRHAWKKSNPTQSDVIEHLIKELATEARWQKAIQHVEEAGVYFTNSPSDIGMLIKEIQADVAAEEAADIKEALFKHFMPKILRGCIRGFPEFYKRIVSVIPEIP
jgi:hypothetical protein